ncbi:MAG: 6-phosphofructo-2-kinase/fructose-2,6-bisphosphatase [Deltaproteobacteria bacterium]|jgi:broad specificity phosphatase PhoE/predicted kinase|nr:6-phosphofructo-2-kinase/fructose-2,6-bisphosphatase [Deltaproteobacteria bacterium]
MAKLYIALVGLPARGKSLMAERLLEGLSADGLRVKVFNNGDLRRAELGARSAAPEFYSPENELGRQRRELIAEKNMQLAREFLDQGGQVAILDATNGSRARRQRLEELLNDAPLLYIECINNDPELLETSIRRKAKLSEFSHLSLDEAIRSFRQRIEYYEQIFVPLGEERCFVRVETLDNRIVDECACSDVPFYLQIRDILISDWIRNLFLVRHSESEFNIQRRIGGNAPLTPRGQKQAQALADHFREISIPFIFTSTRLRSAMTAAPLLKDHPDSIMIALPEFDEISAGVCDGMSYEEIRRAMPEEYAARSDNKYTYVYPDGEGYVTLRDRVSRGFRKALFISGAAPGTIIIGHQAINRMILSLFMYRRSGAVPYIYVPQNEYFHIVATHRKKLLELVSFTPDASF